MKIKTSELTDAALDWAVAECNGYAEGLKPYKGADGTLYLATEHGYTHMESRNWAQGGPIIEREQICIFVRNATWPDHQRWSARPNTADGDSELGPTPLIAAMRCYVASKLGDEVEIPEELK